MSHQQRLPPLYAKAKKQKQKKGTDDDEADLSSSYSSSDTDDVDLDMVALEAESDAVRGLQWGQNSHQNKQQWSCRRNCALRQRWEQGRRRRRLYMLAIQQLTGRVVKRSVQQWWAAAAGGVCSHRAPAAAQVGCLYKNMCLSLFVLQESRMQKAVDVVAGNFNTMRTGRANPAILDRIQVHVLAATRLHAHRQAAPPLSTPLAAATSLPAWCGKSPACMVLQLALLVSTPAAG